MNGALVGWQARAPRDVPRTGFGGDPSPKYLNRHGFQRRSFLYGFDTARASDFVVVCEGVTDVWKVGPPAVALFGKQATSEQRHLLVRTWGHGTLIVLLDADARDEAVQLGRDLGRYFGKGVVVVRLPAGSDPGGLARGMVWGFIRQDARDAGVDLFRDRHGQVDQESTGG
jgi:DNA primase